MKLPSKIIIAILSLTFSLSAFAGNYTWTGTTDTDWGTSANWSPNGIPDSGDTVSISTTTNSPVLDQARTITQIAMNSGTLDLNTYTLTFTGKGLFYGGTITNGKIYSNGGVIAHIVGTTMDCKVDTKTGNLSLRWTEFKDSVRIEYTGSSTISTIGGNKFREYTEIINSGSNPLNLCNTSPYDPDSAFAKIKFVRNSSQYFRVDHKGSDHYFADTVILSNNYSGYFLLGHESTATFKKDIIVENNSAGAVYAQIGYGSGSGNHQLDAGHTLSHTGTNSSSRLYLDRFICLGKVEIDWPNSVYLESNAVFEDTTIIEAQAIELNGAWFKDTTSLSVASGGAIGQGDGGNIFDGPTYIATYNYGYELGNSYPDTFNHNLHLHAVGGNIVLSRQTSGTLYNGNITLTGEGGSIFLGGAIGGATTNTLADGYTIEIDTFYAGNLYFRGFTQAGTQNLDLELTGSAITHFSDDATFNGTFNLVTPGIFLDGAVFNGVTTIERDGGAVSQTSQGGNIFNNTTTLIQDSDTRLAYNNPDTFNADLTIINNNFDFFMSYSTNAPGNYYGGDVYIRNIGTARGTYVGYGTNTFQGNIYVGSNSAEQYATIYLGNGSETSTLASGQTIIEDTMGFTDGALKFNGFTKNGTTPIDLEFSNISEVTFNLYNTFNGAVGCEAGGIYLNGTTFNDDVSLIKIGTSNNTSSGGNTFNGSLAITDSTSSNITLGNASADDFNGDVTFTTTSTGKILPNYLANSTYAGNITINGTADIDFGYYNPGSRTIFDGIDKQVISGNATSDFKKIVMNNVGGYIELERDIKVTDSLIFISGPIISDTNIVEIGGSCIVGDANDTSYVEGPVKKTGNSAFTFPLGGDNYSHTLSISSTSSGSDEFIASYRPFEQSTSTVVDTLIGYISSCEFWELERTTSDSVRLTLQWNNSSCGVDTSLADIIIGVYDSDSLRWISLGNQSTTGNNQKGTVEAQLKLAPTIPNPIKIVISRKPLPSDLEYISYAKLKKKLDGGHYHTVNGKLYFKYGEQYRGGDLTYTIYDKKRQVKMTDTLTKVYGDNRFEIDCRCDLGPGYYTLEVRNDKNELEKLHFKMGIQKFDNTLCGAEGQQGGTPE